jgi:hypothetical protein
MSMTEPKDDGYFQLTLPKWNDLWRDFKEELKSMVPKEDRKYISEKQYWMIANPYYDLIRELYVKYIRADI